METISTKGEETVKKYKYLIGKSWIRTFKKLIIKTNMDFFPEQRHDLRDSVPKCCKKWAFEGSDLFADVAVLPELVQDHRAAAVGGGPRRQWGVARRDDEHPDQTPRRTSRPNHSHKHTPTACNPSDHISTKNQNHINQLDRNKSGQRIYMEGLGKLSKQRNEFGWILRGHERCRSEQTFLIAALLRAMQSCRSGISGCVLIRNL